MRRLVWLVLAVASVQEHAVLDGALRLARPQLYGHLPLTLVTELPRTVSRGAEAWTVFDERGRGTGIFVYTRSRTFRCASMPSRDQSRCLLKLASVIVHEAWHLKNGLDEAGAYDAQLVFLQLKEAEAVFQLNEAAALTINEVRRAKARTLNPGASVAPPAP
jgi:hypothetical protein